MPAAMNPAFHPNILKIYSQNRNTGGYEPINLHRGSIINKDGTKGVRFLYNPSQVTLQHPLNAQQVPAGIPGGDTETTNIATDAGSLGFSLLFDRTYEVWQDAKHQGVLVDVRAIYALTKILTDADAGVKPESISAMSPEPAYFYFGQSGTTLKDRATTRPLSYYGWITSLTVGYTHWSNNMIPMRCGVSISVNLIPNSSSDSDAGGPTSGAPTPGGTRPPVTLPGPGTGRPRVGSATPGSGGATGGF